MADPFYGEIRVFGFSFAPQNWAQCTGGVLPLAQYQGLFAVIGIQYGGNGTTTFGIPNLQGSAVAGQGQGPGLTDRTVAEDWGQSFVTLNTNQIPSHQHTLNGVAANPSFLVNEPSASAHIARTNGQNDFSTAAISDTAMAAQTIGVAGGGTPHENRQPYLAMNFCICVYGDFPIRQ